MPTKTKSSAAPGRQPLRQFRMPPAEWGVVLRAAAARGQTVSAYLRFAALDLAKRMKVK